jgi:protein-S-isoprenylcysteine O-methyltransferase Ste14
MASRVLDVSSSGRAARRWDRKCGRTALNGRSESAESPPGLAGDPTDAAERIARETGLSPLARGCILAYGLIAYATFPATIVYAIGFLANIGVPKSIDSGIPGALAPSLLVNALLLALFAVQHTIMARPAFKRWFTQYIPPAMERSTFVLASAAILGLLFWQWRPLPQVIWSMTDPLGYALLLGLSLLGWAIALASSFMVSHSDLFGLRQTYLSFVGRLYEPLPFKVVGLYRLVRHPLMLGFLVAMWFTPTMTVGHLYFTTIVTAYIFVGTLIEERDLVAHFGEQYRSYRRRVPSILPIPKRTRR